MNNLIDPDKPNSGRYSHTTGMNQNLPVRNTMNLSGPKGLTLDHASTPKKIAMFRPSFLNKPTVRQFADQSGTKIQRSSSRLSKGQLPYNNKRTIASRDGSRSSIKGTGVNNSKTS